VSRETELIDYDAMEKMAQQVRPKMIIGGFSAYTRIVDWARMRAIADSVGATFMVDMAIILCDNEHQKAIDSAVFPGIQGGPLMHAIAAKAVCFGEALKPDFKVYAKQVVVNAKALAAQLLSRGMRLVSGGTDNHMMLIDLRPQKRTGKQVQDIADTVGITLNRNSIPYDEASKFNPSGVRIGTPLVTTRGMREAEMVVIADCLADLIERIDEAAVLESIHERALELCRKFPLPYAFD
jgi:glycine hydroxymethyltransferase